MAPGETMRNSAASRMSAIAAALLAVSLAGVGFAQTAATQNPGEAKSPWTARQTMQPETLAARFLQKNSGPPLIVCVGFGTLYRQAHIHGAEFHGPASTPDGLADLKRWAANLPRNREIVIYCGCCPFAHCPNIRPAFTALQEMGFKSIRVLVLETGLGQDWAEKGAERGYLTDRHGNS